MKEYPCSDNPNEKMVYSEQLKSEKKCENCHADYCNQRRITECKEQDYINFMPKKCPTCKDSGWWIVGADEIDGIWNKEPCPDCTKVPDIMDFVEPEEYLKPDCTTKGVGITKNSAPCVLLLQKNKVLEESARNWLILSQQIVLKDNGKTRQNLMEKCGVISPDCTTKGEEIESFDLVNEFGDKVLEIVESHCDDEWCLKSEVSKLESAYTDKCEEYKKRDSDARRFIDEIVQLRQETNNQKEWLRLNKYRIEEQHEQITMLREALEDISTMNSEIYGVPNLRGVAKRALAKLKGDNDD